MQILQENKISKEIMMISLTGYTIWKEISIKSVRDTIKISLNFKEEEFIYRKHKFNSIVTVQESWE